MTESHSFCLYNGSQKISEAFFMTLHKTLHLGLHLGLHFIPHLIIHLILQAKPLIG